MSRLSCRSLAWLRLDLLLLPCRTDTHSEVADLTVMVRTRAKIVFLLSPGAYSPPKPYIHWIEHVEESLN